MADLLEEQPLHTPWTFWYDRASATEPGARVLRWVDPRVLGPRWQGAFLRLRASDPLHVLGPPPGVT